MAEYNNTLPVFDTLSAAWAKVRGVKSTFWAMLGIMLVASFVLQTIVNIFQLIVPAPAMFLFLVAIIMLQTVFQAGLLYAGIQRALELPISYTMLWRMFELKVILRLGGLILLYLLMMLPLFLCFALSGMLEGSQYSDLAKQISFMGGVIGYCVFIYVLMRLSLALGVVVTTSDKVLVALQKSWRATKGNVLKLIGLTLCSYFILIVSAIPLGLGLIWTMPFSFIVYGELYIRLIGAQGEI